MRLPAIALLAAMPVAASAQQSTPQPMQYKPTVQLLAEQAATCEQIATGQFQQLTKANADLKDTTDKEMIAAKKQATDETAALRAQIETANQRANTLATEKASALASLDKANEHILELETGTVKSDDMPISGPNPKVPTGSLR
jgi:hypothetical protein